MENNEFLALMGVVKNINENVKYMRDKQDAHEKEDTIFKKDISMDLQHLHLIVEKKFDRQEKKLDIFIENQKSENLKINKEIECIKEVLPDIKIDYTAANELVERYKKDKDFTQRLKIGLKEKLFFAGVVFVGNLGFLFLLKPILSKMGIDVTKLLP